LAGVLVVGACLFGAGSGLAPVDARAQAAPDAGAVEVRTRVERPPEGSMRRGALPVPAWGVWVCGGLVVAGALAALGWRLRRSAR
jgi:hypothetical protein